jgi:hemerythrin-like domain-containing protein
VSIKFSTHACKRNEDYNSRVTTLIAYDQKIPKGAHGTMNAIDLLKQDHNFVETLFQKIESTPPSRHEATIKKIKDELDTHATAEEKVFYPALKAKGNKELEDITMEAFEEHAQVKKFLKEISRSTSTEKREAKLKVLIEDVRHHVKEEEGEMFSLVEDQFSSEELEALGERIEAEKKKFQKAKKIPARRPTEAKGVLSTVIDMAKEFVTGETDDGSGKPRSASRSRKSTSGAKSAKASSGNGGSAKSGSGKASSSKSGSSGNARSTSGSGKSQKAASSGSGSSSGGRKSASTGNGSKKTASGNGNGGGRKASGGSAAGSRSTSKASSPSRSGGGSKAKSSSK